MRPVILFLALVACEEPETSDTSAPAPVPEPTEAPASALGVESGYQERSCGPSEPTAFSLPQWGTLWTVEVCEINPATGDNECQGGVTVSDPESLKVRVLDCTTGQTARMRYLWAG